MVSYYSHRVELNSYSLFILAGFGSVQVQDKQIIRLIGKIPTLSALAYHKCTGRKAAPPNQRLTYAENFLFMLDGGMSPDYRPNPRLARALVRQTWGREY
jgi:citrate synthase